MDTFIIEGGRQLTGTITPQGAKNETLQVICATLLTSEPVRIDNIPDILDVNNLIALLTDIGVRVTRHSRTSYTFQADSLNLDFLESDEFVRKCSSLRGSVLMIGPLLGRFGRAIVAKPGGDKIGRRRLDTHFLGFSKLGAAFEHVPGRDVYQLHAGFCDRHSEHDHGVSARSGRYDDIQCRLRALHPAALPYAQRYGR